MSTYRLDRLFHPRSVAVVGVSRRTGTLGRTVLANVLAAGFQGRVSAINPHFAEARAAGRGADDAPAAEPLPGELPALEGAVWAASLDNLVEAADLVVVCSPRASVIEVVEAAGRTGAFAAILMTPGLGAGVGSIAESARLAARRHGLRLVGPHCLGVIAPHAQLNASFAAHIPKPGDLALVSQSGAVAAGLVEWGVRHHVGFSGVIALGDQVDVDFADSLDYFAGDARTRAVLLYIESIQDAPKFMSAARAAARTKPVVVIKSGRHAQTAQLAATHTGALALSDAVYDAAFRRAGLLRVFDLDELFAAAETLGRQRPFHGRRLAIMTNDPGIGLLAVDRLVDLGGELAELSEQTRATLAAQIPTRKEMRNPVDVTGYIDPVRNAAALTTLLADRQNDAVLVLNIPTAFSDPVALAQSTVDAVAAYRKGRALKKPVFTVWLGQDDESRRIFERAGIPNFSTEAEALAGFMHLVRYRQAQELLMETPDALPRDFVPDTARAQALVARVLREGRAWLDTTEVQELMRAYDIPMAPAIFAASADEAVAVARPILEEGRAVAVKIVSPDILHKSDIGGVRLDLVNEQAVRAAAESLLAYTGNGKPIRVSGVIVQPMVRRRGARELIAGLADDPAFGPVVVFGRGGTAVEVIDDKALALPPLDMNLADVLIKRTRVSRILAGYRDTRPADEEAVRLVLVKLSQIATDVPEVREIDINPLLADEHGVLGIDARVRVEAVSARANRAGHPRLAVRPYPKAWERTIECRGGRSFFVRPVRPEDEQLFIDFVGNVGENDLRLRFFAPIRDFNHAFMARLVQVDYARAIAFVALEPDSGEMAGVVRLHADANHETGEYAVMVRSDLKGVGLGWELMRLIIEWARADGIRLVEGQVLRDNAAMIGMVRKLGFSVAADPSDSSIVIVRMPVDTQKMPASKEVDDAELNDMAAGESDRA